MPDCRVCRRRLGSPLYESEEDVSITTMNAVIAGKTRVHLCDSCGHLQTDELPHLAAYYAHEYEINLSSEEDDQLYGVVDGRPVFRADHQAAVLRAKVALRPGQRILDYGCAKAPTLRKLLGVVPDLEPFLFDVTDRYVPFWKRFPTPARWSLHRPDPSWAGSMDVVLSFYALEHVADLHGAVADVKALLRPGGIFYFVVPNVYANVADFIVADHINHFSKASLGALLGAAGFTDVHVDDRAHDAAFVVSAELGTRTAPSPPPRATPEPSEERAAALALARYWREIGHRIRTFEAQLGAGDQLAIYGAGFYGAFLTSALVSPSRVRCYIDRNPFLHGTRLHGRPVLAPDELPADVTHLMVGLNPVSARAAIESLGDFAPPSRHLTYFYL